MVDKNLRIEVIEVNVGGPAIANAFNFGQLPNLREAAEIISIEAYDGAQVSVSPLNKAVISNTILKKSFIKLVESGGSNALLATLPLVDISKQNAASVIEKLNLPTIDWEKTTINIAETTGLSANESFIFKVKYLKGIRK